MFLPELSTVTVSNSYPARSIPMDALREVFDQEKIAETLQPIALSKTVRLTRHGRQLISGDPFSPLEPEMGVAQMTMAGILSQLRLFKRLETRTNTPLLLILQDTGYTRNIESSHIISGYYRELLEDPALRDKGTFDNLRVIFAGTNLEYKPQNTLEKVRVIFNTKEPYLFWISAPEDVLRAVGITTPSEITFKTINTAARDFFHAQLIIRKDTDIEQHIVANEVHLGSMAKVFLGLTGEDLRINHGETMELTFAEDGRMQVDFRNKTYLTPFWFKV